jgi:hypothetical protein
VNHPATVLRYAATHLPGVLTLRTTEAWTSYSEEAFYTSLDHHTLSGFRLYPS